jgi:hypothetical protein
MKQYQQPIMRLYLWREIDAVRTSNPEVTGDYFDDEWEGVE